VIGQPLFFLILPLAVAAGWMIGRQRGTRKTGERVSKLSQVYFRGLNYLLNEQQDKAIELFLEIAEVDANTVETQLALGTLFRRRGEVERAIRLHQGLVTREGLNDEHRLLAILELGEDYMRAGLLDRAETLFSDLVRMEPTAPRALRHLITIYQSERDWVKAIDCAQRLQQISDEPIGVLVAHFHCELAEMARAEGDLAAAEAQLTAAQQSDPDSVRVAILRAAQKRQSGDYAAAIGFLEHAVACDPAFLPEIIDPLLDCYQRLGQHDRARQFLDLMVAEHPGAATVLAKGHWLGRHVGAQAAADFLSEALPKRPSIRGQAALIALIREGRIGSANAALEAVASVTENILKLDQPYRCERCGFGAKALHWQCPSCKSWGSTKPISLQMGV